MAKEWFTMWFQDGGGRTLISGRRELRKYAKQYDFDADEVIREGETTMREEFSEVVGGVYRRSEAFAQAFKKSEREKSKRVFREKNDGS